MMVFEYLKNNGNVIWLIFIFLHVLAQLGLAPEAHR